MSQRKNGIADTLNHWEKRANNPGVSIPILGIPVVDEEASSPLVNIIQIGESGVSDAQREPYQGSKAILRLIRSRPDSTRSVYHSRAYPLFSRPRRYLSTGVDTVENPERQEPRCDDRRPIQKNL